MYQPRRQRKSEHLLLKSGVSKLMLIVTAILVLILLLALRNDGTEDVEAVITGTESTTTVAQSGAYISYLSTQQQEKMQSDTFDALRYNTDAFYTDVPSGLVYNEANVNTTASGCLTYAINSPTRPVGDGAFITNVWALKQWELTDIATYEGLSDTEIDGKMGDWLLTYFSSGTGTKTTQRCWGVESKDTSDVKLAGAVGPAILNRHYYDTKMWETSRYWGNVDVTGADNHMNVDIMLCASADVEGYFNGNEVAVTYVQFNVRDAKAHAWPWGVSQTFISNGERQFADNGNSLKGVSLGGISQDGTAYTVFKQLMDLNPNRNSTLYWYPCLGEGGESRALSGGTLSTDATACMFEYYVNQGIMDYAALLEGADRDLVVVGVLVYEDRWATQCT